MAAPPDPLFSAIFAEAAYWTTPYPDYVDTMNIVGGGSANNHSTMLRCIHDPAQLTQQLCMGTCDRVTE